MSAVLLTQPVSMFDRAQASPPAIHLNPAGWKQEPDLQCRDDGGGAGVVGWDDSDVKKRKAKPSRTFVMNIWQQPERARLCSYKEENETIDRRPVDPPPVVEVRSLDGFSQAIYDSSSLFVRVSIVQAVPSNDGEPASPIFAPVRTTTGADATAGEVIQTPEKLKGMDGHPASLCIFAKLSVRVPGVFRLKFTLFETSENGICEVAYIISDPFEVFSPKLFKGMRESTSLTRHLAAQGLKVKLRTDTSVGRQSESRRRASGAGAAGQKSTSSTTLAHSGSLSSPLSSSDFSVGSATAASRSRSSSSHHHHPTLPQPPPRLPPAPSPALRTTSSLVWRSSPHISPDLGTSYGSERYFSGGSASTSASGSRTGSPNEYGGPGKRMRLAGDDGSIPSLREITSRFDLTSTSPSSDLSQFSLSTPHLAGRSPHLLASRSASYGHSPPSSSSSTPPSGRSAAPFSLVPSTSSTRTSSILSSAHPEAFDAPPVGRLMLGGDDGIPRLPLPSGNFMPPRLSNLLVAEPPALPPLESPALGGSYSAPSTSTSFVAPPFARSAADVEHNEMLKTVLPPILSKPI